MKKRRRSIGRIVKKLKTFNRLSKFDKRSIRWKRVKGRRDRALKVGCFKGEFKRGRCRIGMKAYALYKIKPPKTRR